MRSRTVTSCQWLLAMLSLGFAGVALEAGNPASSQTPAVQSQAPASPPAQEKGPTVSVSTKAVEADLPNGVHLLIVEDHRAPQVVFQLHIQGAGPYYDPPSAIGLAAATADVAQRSTAAMSFDDLLDHLKELDSVVGIITPGGSTVAVAEGRGPARHLRALLKLTASQVQTPQFSNENIQASRKPYVEVATKVRTVPRFGVSELFSKTVYGKHPAAVATPFAAPSITTLTAAQMAAFAKEHYVPDHAILAIAGDVTVADAKKAAEDSLAGWKRSGRKLAPAAKATEPTASIRLVDMPVTYARVIVGTLTVDRAHPDADALEVASRVLASGKQGRLAPALGPMLAPEYGVTEPPETSVSAQKYGGTWRTGAAIQVDSVSKALAVINEQFAALRTDLVPAEELAVGKKAAVDRYLASRENLLTRLANAIGTHMFQLPADYWEKRPENLSAVTAEQVRAVARKYLDPKRVVIAIAGPRDKVEPQLKGLGPVTVVRPDALAVAAQ